jgi:prostatic aicd phosphatase
MNEVINGTLVDRKINLYSAHDLNVAAMLKTLKIFDNHIPRFTSSVIIELHEKNGNYFIKVNISFFSSIYKNINNII